MINRAHLRLAPLALLLVLCLTCTGAYATWRYSELPLGTASDKTSLEMSIFHWEGSEILPDDEEEGLAHATLIDKIINGAGIGLNSAGSYLNEQIRNRQHLFYK